MVGSLSEISDTISFSSFMVVANLARRGRVRFARSRPPTPLEPQGRAVEAMKGNPTPTVIFGVDAPKLTHETKS